MSYLLAFKGLPGTGKTTLSRCLAQSLGWPLVDKDDIKDVIHAGCANSGPLSYTVTFQVARRQLVCGLSVICDSPLMYAESYANARRIASEANARLLVIETVLSDGQLWRERIEARKHDPRFLAGGHYVTDWAVFNAPSPAYGGRNIPAYPMTVPCLQVDTALPLPAVLATITSWLAEHGVTAAPGAILQ